MTLPADLNVYLSAILFGVGAFIAAMYVGLIVWTARDIRARSRDMLAQIMAILLVAVFNLPGLIVYILMRPHTKLAEEYERSLIEEAVLQDLDRRHTCPECQRQIESDFIICPHCHQQLRLRCVGCGRLLNPSWDVCPYCGRLPDQGDGGRDIGPQPQEVQSDEEAVTPEPVIERTSESYVKEPSPSPESPEE
jgi:RNA polymerase subunit RPABC4/transcription elongation factor Spt4/F0F1-type ATP synthase membrane subunit c/vacuolar-type H+-ATPase subunit K